MSIGQSLGRYATGIVALRPGDVWLASFPRTGNTWVRTLLANLISLSELTGREVDHHYVRDTMPSLGSSNLLEPWPFKALPRFIKTHQRYRPVLFAVPHKTVYVLRDPRDVMVSYFHFRQSRKSHPYQGSFAEFIRDPHHGLRGCVQHYCSWSPHITYLVRYEELLNDTRAELQEMLTALGITVSDELVQQAVARSSFRRMQQIEQTTGAPHPERVGDAKLRGPRKGQSRQWPDYFSDEDILLFDKICEEYEFDLYT